jgi:inorganic pyrophosphatase
MGTDLAATLWDLPLSPEPAWDGAASAVYAVVETPRESSNKYEYDPEMGVFRLDRVLANSVHFPGDYGFIPSTIAEDGEPLDVLLVATGPSEPGTLVVIRPIGVADVVDAGANDAKIIAVARDEPRDAAVHDISHLAPHRVREIEHFFSIYKDLAVDAVGQQQTVVGFHSAPEARRKIAEAYARYRAARG